MVSLVHMPWRHAAAFHRDGHWQESTLAQLLDDTTAKRPDATAYVVDETLTTWGQLHAATSGLAQSLLGRGVSPSDVVVIVLEDGPGIVAAMTAVQSIGAVAAPLSHGAGSEEIATIVRRTGARLVLVDEPVDDPVALIEHLEVLQLGPVDSWEQGPAHGLDYRLGGGPASPDEVADIMFTSGTTGRPKGVMNTANTKLAGVRGFLEEHPLTSDDVVGILPPMSHNAGWLYSAVPAVAVGATLAAVGRGDPIRMLDRMERHGVTVAFMVPTHMRDLVTTYQQFPGRWQLALRLVITGAAPSHEQVVRSAVSEWGVTVVSMYGMIECQGLTFTRADDPVDVVASTVGRACPGATVELRDPETGDIVRDEGIVGEVVASGPLNFVGYFDDETATRAALTKDGWLMTGDLGTWVDARLQIVGRRKEVILRGGLTLAPEDVEAAFAEVVGVGEVVVVGLPDERLGERVCLAVTGEVPSRDTLRKHLATRGWGSQLLPDEVRPLAVLPRTDLGKPKRSEVRSILLAPGRTPDGSS